eukprot:CAMPEP_0198118810 /NCGR_PEP_ID=MMETSP1442-20131203/23169_1 /TAXON_ID= /ORGANISM="Craspedostauros australis, Strain CCMP3328" /LENGTH=126 /DNA_ID=CAMNT_0043777131 /DNA_START=168 /DNA_END=548 /DNA_ORIENTATION=+
MDSQRSPAFEPSIIRNADASKTADAHQRRQPAAASFFTPSQTVLSLPSDSEQRKMPPASSRLSQRIASWQEETKSATPNGLMPKPKTATPVQRVKMLGAQIKKMILSLFDFILRPNRAERPLLKIE